jgi:hypothetical protein
VADQLEVRRQWLVEALREARPRFQWMVRFDDTPRVDRVDELAMFVVGQDEAGRTWQVALPSQRLLDEEHAVLVDEIVESMDDELPG